MIIAISRMHHVDVSVSVSPQIKGFPKTMYNVKVEAPLFIICL